MCYAIVFSQNTSRYHAFPPNSVSLSNATGNVGSTQVYPSHTLDVTVKVTITLTCRTTVAAGTVVAGLTWTDPSSTAQNDTTTVATCTTLGTSSFISYIRAFRVKNGTAVNATITVVNAPTYDASILVEQIN